MATAGYNTGMIRQDECGLAPEALLGFFRYQSKQSKSLGIVERMTHRGLPYNFNPARRRALAAKQVDSELIAQRRSVALQS